jgi:hypothetical protein
MECRKFPQVAHAVPQRRGFLTAHMGVAGVYLLQVVYFGFPELIRQPNLSENRHTQQLYEIFFICYSRDMFRPIQWPSSTILTYLLTYVLRGLSPQANYTNI